MNMSIKKDDGLVIQSKEYINKNVDEEKPSREIFKMKPKNEEGSVKSFPK